MNSPTLHSIGEPARRTGGRVKTLQNCSDHAPVPPAGRGPAGHPLYGDDVVARSGLGRSARDPDGRAHAVGHGDGAGSRRLPLVRLERMSGRRRERYTSLLAGANGRPRPESPGPVSDRSVRALCARTPERTER